MWRRNLKTILNAASPLMALPEPITQTAVVILSWTIAVKNAEFVPPATLNT